MRKHLPKIIPFLLLGLLFALQIQGRGKTTNEPTTIPDVSPVVVSDKTEAPSVSKSFQAEDTAIKIEKCKIEAKTNTDNFFNPVKAILTESFKTCVQDKIVLLQQTLGIYSGSPQDYGFLMNSAASMCESDAEIVRNNLKIETDKRFNQEYLGCLNG